jgi:hypothetical protein
MVGVRRDHGQRNARRVIDRTVDRSAWRPPATNRTVRSKEETTDPRVNPLAVSRRSPGRRHHFPMEKP